MSSSHTHPSSGNPAHPAHANRGAPSLTTRDIVTGLSRGDLPSHSLLTVLTHGVDGGLPPEECSAGFALLQTAAEEFEALNSLIAQSPRSAPLSSCFVLFEGIERRIWTAIEVLGREALEEKSPPEEADDRSEASRRQAQVDEAMRREEAEDEQMRRELDERRARRERRARPRQASGDSAHSANDSVPPTSPRGAA